MKRIFSVLCLFSLLLPLSCNSSNGSGVPFFAGVWTGGLSFVEDTCGTIFARAAFFNHLVNQNEFQIIIDDGVAVFSGNVQSDNSFSASRKRDISPLPGRKICSETVTWRYESVNEGEGTADFVVRLAEISCDEVAICRYGFSGFASRNSRQIPIAFPSDPIPVPEAGEGAVDAADLAAFD